MSELGDSQFKRTPIFVALALAVALVLGVLIGAKLVYSKAANQPVAMAALDSPDATSAECASLLDALPEKLLGHRRAELADPAPDGAAAWASNSLEKVTLRCGVSLPLQYTELSTLIDAEGTQWLQVIDATPGSDMQTWYSINSFPTVAVTADAASMNGQENPVKGLGDALEKLTKRTTEPNPIPLSALATPKAEDAQCTALMQAMPESVADGYARASVNIPAGVAWVKQGHEPIVVRCGVEDPASYEAGAQLNQVDDIPWFEDTKLANGTTSGAYYALGRQVNVVMSMPSDAGNTAITTLSRAISVNTQVK